MQVEPIIFEATAECRESFAKCQMVEGLMKEEWAENRLADFNLWASGIGASARKRASLDARLALRLDARDIIANLLRLLKLAVEECMALAQSNTTQSNAVPEDKEDEEEEEHRGRTDTLSPQTAPQRSFSPWSDDSSSQSQSDAASNPVSSDLLSKAMRKVDLMLDQLTRIAVTIRRSGTRSRLQRADRMLRLEDHQDLRTHLITVLLSQGPFSAESTFSPEHIDPSKLSAVQLQLINCNLKRRNRFLYAQKHSEGLDAISSTLIHSQETTYPKTAPEQPEAETRPQRNPEKPIPSISKLVSANPVDHLRDPSVKTGTSASGVTDLIPSLQNLVPSEAATTQLSTTVTKLDYPHPPKMNVGALVFRCPCCCQALPAMIADKNRWKKHVAEDLCPYSCILPNCPKPEILYTTKETWKTHLLEDHRSVEYWVCFACTDTVQFDQEHAFVAHTLEEHGDVISKDQIPTLKSVSKRSAPAEISSCPLCTWPTAEDGKVDRGALIDHVAEDVHAFSLRSLPWAPDGEHDSEERIEYGATKAQAWLAMYQLSPESNQDIQPLVKPKKPSVSHYFDLNEYFAEDFECSSSSGTDSNNSMKRELEGLRGEGPLIYSDSSGRTSSGGREQNHLDSSAARKACWTVPFERNPGFVGRHFELDLLENALSAKEQTPNLAIMGLGGVGKTQIALEVAYRIRGKYPECSVFWISATDTESVQRGYLEISEQLGIPRSENEQADVKKLVQRHLSQESAGQWLLIFDDANDLDVWINNSANEKDSLGLKDYFPRSRQGCIVLTTRNRNIAIKLAKSNVISVSEMNEEMAMQLLSNSLIEQELLSNREKVLELLERLTFLPLAIVQAAAYINKNATTLLNYLSLLNGQEQDVIDILSLDFEGEGRYHNIKNPIATTWLISFEHIRRLDSLAAEYLAFMSCLDPKNIPQSLLPPAQSTKKAMDAIGTLCAYSFVIKRPKNNALDVPQLVYLAMRNWLRMEGLLTQWTVKAIKRLEEVLPNDDHANTTVWQVYVAQIRYVLESDSIAADGMLVRAKLLSKFAKCLYSNGRYNEAEKPFLQVLDTFKMLAAGHSDTLASMGNLALVYKNQGRWKEAEELEVQIMKTFKIIRGTEDRDTLISMSNLASTYRNQGRWKEAEELEIQAIEIFNRVLGTTHPSTLRSMGNLAFTYRNQGRWKKAEELEVQVMKTFKMTLGAEHPDTITSMSNLASTYRNQGRWKEAEELEVQAMETYKRVLGTNHPYTLTSMSNLASIYRNQKRWKKAEELETQAMETFKTIFGIEHPFTLTSMGNLASTYRNQERWKDAEKLGVQVMQTSLRVLGSEHPSTLSSMADLASTLKCQSRDEEAILLMKECFQLRKRILGRQHPYTKNSLEALNEWEDGEHETSN